MLTSQFVVLVFLSYVDVVLLTSKVNIPLNSKGDMSKYDMKKTADNDAMTRC